MHRPARAMVHDVAVAPDHQLETRPGTWGYHGPLRGVKGSTTSAAGNVPPGQAKKAKH